MKFLPLVWAMLWRSKARTWLTFLSIVVAFLLFGLLQSLTEAFNAGVRLSADDMLLVTYKHGPTRPLPLAYKGRIAAIDGVQYVDPEMFIGGYYQDPKNQLAAIAVDPELFGKLDSRVLITDAHRKAFQDLRMGAVAGRDLAQKHGWKIGDPIPLISSPKKDGTTDWQFRLVGLYEMDDKRFGQHIPAAGLFVRFDYYQELDPYPGHVLWYALKVTDAKRAGAIGKAIDHEFLNSEFATRTQTQAEFQRGFIKQFGDIGVIMSAILGAVFFTLLLVAGNTMMQAFRERVPELAVLKTVGFTDRGVAAMIVAESLVLCLFAAAIGIALAALIIPPIRLAMAQFLGGLALQDGTLIAAVGLAFAIGSLAALVPAWKSARLSVVDALAER
jgi:putative ABC transport system permease protein